MGPSRPKSAKLQGPGAALVSCASREVPPHLAAMGFRAHGSTSVSLSGASRSARSSRARSLAAALIASWSASACARTSLQAQHSTRQHQRSPASSDVHLAQLCLQAASPDNIRKKCTMAHRQGSGHGFARHAGQRTCGLSDVTESWPVSKRQLKRTRNQRIAIDTSVPMHTANVMTRRVAIAHTRSSGSCRF